MPYKLNKWKRPKGYYAKVIEEKKLSKQLKAEEHTGICISKISDLQQHVGLVALPSNWSVLKSSTEIRFSQIEFIEDESTVSRCVMVREDLTWQVKLHGRYIPKDHPIFEGISTAVADVDMLTKLISEVEKCKICPGNLDQPYIELVRGKGGQIVKAISLSGEKDVSAYIEDDYNAKTTEGTIYHATIRTVECHFITEKKRCSKCSAYRNNLRAMVARRKSQEGEKKTSSDSKVNLRFLNTTELRERASNLQKEKVTLKRSLSRTVKRLVSSEGIAIDKTLQCDFKTIMEDSNRDVLKAYPEDSFQHLFWEEQLRHARCSDSRQMRWHPTIIRWCLFLKFKSSSAYEALRSSGFVKLPSQRTLSDYSNYIKPKPGINQAVLEELISEVESLGSSEANKYVVLLHDEMKIKQDLVYDKNTGELIGFTNLGDINEELMKLENGSNIEKSKDLGLASHVLVLMVRGLASSLQMSIGYFPTDSCKSDNLYTIIWEAITSLEVACDLKVMVSTSDGASWNRKFYRMHRVAGAPRDIVVFKGRNTWSDDKRFIYFVSDVPHLMKTTRNCWANSESHRKSRSLWNGNPILWRHLSELIMDDRTRDIHLLHKIGYEHINLTSFSIMRVNLAAQVLSETVSHAIQRFGPPEAGETAKFVMYMDKFFDCLNVRCKEEHLRKRKPNLAPYSNLNDPRLSWLEHDFLNYFTEWQDRVARRPGHYTASQRNAMLISRQTWEGLQMSVKSFVEVTRYLLNHGVEYVLSEKLCQDPLEAHFSKHRHRGGANNDPTVQAFGYQENAIRLQKSHHLQCISGNTGRRKRAVEEVIDTTPLQKRCRTGV